jgi:hypothetical protein
MSGRDDRLVKVAPLLAMGMLFLHSRQIAQPFSILQSQIINLKLFHFFFRHT